MDNVPYLVGVSLVAPYQHNGLPILELFSSRSECIGIIKGLLGGSVKPYGCLIALFPAGGCRL